MLNEKIIKVRTDLLESNLNSIYQLHEWMRSFGTMFIVDGSSYIGLVFSDDNVKFIVFIKNHINALVCMLIVYQIDVLGLR